MQATSKACGARSVHSVAATRATHLKRASEVRRPRLIRRGIECGPHLQNSAFRTMGLTVA
jgi:type VI protein secretion system component VasA